MPKFVKSVSKFFAKTFKLGKYSSKEDESVNAGKDGSLRNLQQELNSSTAALSSMTRPDLEVSETYMHCMSLEKATRVFAVTGLTLAFASMITKLALSTSWAVDYLPYHIILGIIQVFVAGLISYAVLKVRKSYLFNEGILHVVYVK